jgi:TonB-dependent SusC/RagA subfamily outer membrane receptor
MKIPNLGDATLCMWQSNYYKQLLRTMKLTSILLPFIGLQANANSRSQALSFIGENVSVKKVVVGIEKQTDFVLLFNNSVMNEAKAVTLNVQDVTLEEVLKVGLKGQSLNFYVGCKTVFIGKFTGWLSGGSLDESQVNAYGQASKGLGMGNNRTVKTADIERQPVGNPSLALEGRVPGLFITQSNGVPGGGVTGRIQGLNSISKGNDPLFVVDGVPYIVLPLPIEVYGVFGNSGRLIINPSGIENIEVLEDADATSINGSRAADGAVLITTKKGKIGQNRVGSISRMTRDR